MAGTAALVMLVAASGGAANAAEEVKAAEEAAAIEARLIDLAVRAGTLKSLQNNAAPVDTGVLAERQTTPVVPGLQDASQIAQVDAEIARLTARYSRLTGLAAGVLPAATEARQPAQAAGGSVAPAGVSGQVAPGDAGGWFGSTTVSSGSGDGARGAVLPPGAAAGWSTTSPASQENATAGYGQVPGRGPGQIAGQDPAQVPGQVSGGWGQAMPATPGAAGTGRGWSGDTQGGRIGEVQPPGVVYPGTEDGAHERELAGLDQARAGLVPVQPQPQPQSQVQPGLQQPAIQPLDDAEAAYEQAYGLLLQQDYGAAQFAFQSFLAHHGDNPLAGNAQYWLGEIHFVTGKYKEAARAFLDGYEKYGDGNKGADSLLKLALSLDKLNQSKAACSSLNEFFRRYGSADEAPVEQAKEVRQRLKCRS